MYLFKVKTKEGHSFKVLSELISKYVQEGTFTIDSTGIKLIGFDTQRTKLIHVELPADNFTTYKCKSEPLHISVNMIHFYRMLKSIKKKENTLMLYILESDPLKLYLHFNQNGEDETKGIVSNINVTLSFPSDEEKAEGYTHPIVVTSREFQKIKQLNKISANIEVLFHRRIIDLFCDRGIYGKKVVLGDIDDEDENENEEDIEEYKQTFTSDQILDLVKLSAISNNIHIYHRHDLPLYIKMNAGSLGTVNLYIKSQEFIKYEDEQEEFEKEPSVCDLKI